jgi:hypothetical protein
MMRDEGILFMLTWGPFQAVGVEVLVVSLALRSVASPFGAFELVVFTVGAPVQCLLHL